MHVSHIREQSIQRDIELYNQIRPMVYAMRVIIYWSLGLFFVKMLGRRNLNR